jgi:hypothetical protein
VRRPGGLVFRDCKSDVVLIAAYFEKPLMSTFIMFVGMAMAMPLFWVSQCIEKWQKPKGRETEALSKQS